MPRKITRNAVVAVEAPSAAVRVFNHLERAMRELGGIAAAAEEHGHHVDLKGLKVAVTDGGVTTLRGVEVLDDLLYIEVELNIHDKE